MELIIISGRSGSGKSVALRALEDAGYYCVDNIPLPLIPQLATYLATTDRSAVVSLDIRNLPEDPNALGTMLKALPTNVTTKLIFLDCKRSALIRRYSDSRRLHPLSNQDLSLESAIDLEKRRLDPLYQQANYIIDTTTFSSHELAENLRALLKGTANTALKIIVESFGFKYGVPANADYVFDVRFLPNPHWEVHLRPMTGLEQPVIDFLQQQPEVADFIAKTQDYLTAWLPALENNNRSYLTISIGCTGGKHRSVYIAEQLAAYFKQQDKSVQIYHRSLEQQQRVK